MLRTHQFKKYTQYWIYFEGLCSMYLGCGVMRNKDIWSALVALYHKSIIMGTRALSAGEAASSGTAPSSSASFCPTASALTSSKGETSGKRYRHRDQIILRYSLYYKLFLKIWFIFGFDSNAIKLILILFNWSSPQSIAVTLFISLVLFTLFLLPN